MSKIILSNPKSANSKHRIPNSLLLIEAVINSDYVINRAGDFVFPELLESLELFNNLVFKKK